MHGSATVGWLLAGVCALTGGACLLRAFGGEGRRRWAAASEALMGFGMAAMAVPTAAGWTVPPLVYVLLFAAVGCGELVLLGPLLRRCGSRRGRAVEGAHGALHHGHHLLGAAAMVHMVVPMATAPGGGGGGAGHAGGPSMAMAGGTPLLTAALLAYFAAYVLVTGARLLPAPSPAPAGDSAGGAGGGLAWAARSGPAGRAAALPGLATACRIAMGTGMFAMLLTM